MSYLSPFTDQELSHRAAPAGFTAYTPDKNTNMGIYMLLSENWASQNWKELHTTPAPANGMHTLKWKKIKHLLYMVICPKRER